MKHVVGEKQKQNNIGTVSYNTGDKDDKATVEVKVATWHTLCIVRFCCSCAQFLNREQM